MHIYWYGQACFKIQTDQTVIFTDPYNKEIGLTPPRTKANIVTISHNHEDHNNIDAVADENSIVLNTPGEYDAKGVKVTGIASFHDKKEGREKGANTIFIFEAEDLRVCHLGDLGHMLSEEQVEQIGTIDILLIPAGEGPTLSAKEAAEVVGEIEPKMIIPMHYKIPGLKYKFSEVDKFCKAMGIKKPGPQEKILVKKKLLTADKTEVVILKHLG